MDVEIKELPALRVAAVEHLGPYTEIGHAFSRLGAMAGRAGLFQQPAPLMIALYHDDPESTPAVGSSRVDLQACKLEYSIVSPK